MSRQEDKYKNPDERCEYPYIHDGLTYCWGYAKHIDRGTYTEDFCKECGFWNEEE